MNDRSPKLLNLTLWIVLLTLGASVAFVPIRADNDCWWHVKSGKYIWENGLPDKDVFSFTASDHEWDNHEWLTQVIMWKIFHWGDETGLGGWRSVILFITILSMATWAAVAWLVQRRIRHWPLALAIAIWALDIGRRTLYPRPPVITYLLLALSLWIMYEVRLRRWPVWRLWILIPLTALWSNLHGGWMAELAALGIFMGEGMILAFYGGWFKKNASPSLTRRAEQGRRQAIAFFLVLVGCIIASCCNPSGWRLYLLPGRVMKDAFLVRSIGELLAPDFYYTVAFEMALLTTAVGLVFIRRRPITFSDAILFMFWGHQGVQHVRHLPMFAVAAAPLMAVVARQALRDLHQTDLGKQLELRQWSSWMLGAAACLLAVYVARNPREGESYIERNWNLLHDREYIAENYPTEACNFVLLNDIRGRMFNRNAYAGYLIWRLAPEHTKVFTDSRFDIFGGKFLQDENIIAAGYESPDPTLHWRQRLDFYQIDWILIPESEGLDARLRTDPNWERIYRDPPAARTRIPWVIWIRKTEATSTLRERCRKAYEAIANPSRLPAISP